jgi:hypothetical protein
MPLKGSAFLALWNDIEPERRAEYDDWHTFEHVPERVGIAGVMAGRRYVARERSEQRYFTLYELDGLEVLEGAGYTDVVENPTDWSRSMRPSFRNVVRRPCATILSAGFGIAGSVATFRFSVRNPVQAVDAERARSALEPLLETGHITAAHLGQEIALMPPPSMRELGWNQTTDATQQHVLIVEGLERSDLEAARPDFAEILRQRLNVIGSITWASFDLAFTIETSGLSGPLTNRQPARCDLQNRWSGKAKEVTPVREQ